MIRDQKQLQTWAIRAIINNKMLYYHVRIESPVYVRHRIQHAWDWCTVMTQRDVVGREMGRGFMFGNACKN